MNTTIRIVAPDIHAGDAVGNHCIHLAQDLNAAGLPTFLYAQRSTPLDAPILPLEALFEQAQTGDRLLVSYSIHDPYLEQLLAMPQRKACYFHGVTPPELLREHEPVTADLCARSALQFPLLARFDLLLFNSEYNRRDLSAYIDTSRGIVIPPISPSFKLFSWPEVHRVGGGDPVILVLGRVVPHKRIEQAIELTAMLHKRGCIARLEVVGPCSNDGYRTHLNQMIEALGLNAYVQMRGMVDEEALQGCYARASVLLSTSEHEGFCVPVLEAMHLGVPVVVRQGTAAVDVGGSAVLAFSTADEAAGQLHKVLNDQGARDELVKLGRERASAMIRQASVDIWIPLLERL